MSGEVNVVVGGLLVSAGLSTSRPSMCPHTDVPTPVGGVVASYLGCCSGQLGASCDDCERLGWVHLGGAHLLPRVVPSLWPSHDLCHCPYPTPTTPPALRPDESELRMYESLAWTRSSGTTGKHAVWLQRRSSTARGQRSDLPSATYLVGPVMSTVRPASELTPTFSSAGSARHTHSFCAAAPA